MAVLHSDGVSSFRGDSSPAASSALSCGADADLNMLLTEKPQGENAPFLPLADALDSVEGAGDAGTLGSPLSSAPPSRCFPISFECLALNTLPWLPCSLRLPFSPWAKDEERGMGEGVRDGLGVEGRGGRWSTAVEALLVLLPLLLPRIPLGVLGVVAGPGPVVWLRCT